MNTRIINLYSPVCTGKSKYLEALKLPLDKTMIVDFKGDVNFFKKLKKLSKAKIVDIYFLTKENVLRAMNIVQNEIKFGNSKYFVIDDASLLNNYCDEVYKMTTEALGKDILIIIASQEPICENISVLEHFNFLEQEDELNRALKELI